jgi:hypothetical protein
LLEQISNPTFHKEKRSYDRKQSEIWIPSATLSLSRAREGKKKPRASVFLAFYFLQ